MEETVALEEPVDEAVAEAVALVEAEDVEEPLAEAVAVADAVAVAEGQSAIEPPSELASSAPRRLGQGPPLIRVNA